MDELTKGVQDESPRCMMFADDVVWVNKSTNVREGKLGRWRWVLEKNGLKLCGAKTDFLKNIYTPTRIT